MDSEFTARYQGEPQQDPERDPRPGRGDVEPVAEPQPLAPSGIREPSPPVGAAETDEGTNVLPERESGAAPPPGANEPGHPGPVNQRTAHWENPPRSAGMRPGATEPAQRHQAGSPA